MTLPGINDDSDATERVARVNTGSLKAPSGTALNTVPMYRLARITHVDERVELATTIDEILSRR